MEKKVPQILKTFGNKNNPCLLILNGFLGEIDDYNFLIENLKKDFFIIFPKIIPTNFDDNCDNLINILDQENISTCILIGYSFGARLGFFTYLKHKERFTKLIFESINYGLDDLKEKQLRIKKDQELANMIKEFGLKYFLDYWYNQELFYLNDNQKFELSKKANNLNSNECINFLNNLSVGKMPYLKNYIKEISIPSLLITGEKDYKFTEIAKDIVNINSNIQHKIISEAGHNTHLQNNSEFLYFLLNFLYSI